MKTILILMLSIPMWLSSWTNKNHETFMDAYPDNVIEMTTHAEYGYVVDTLALGDTLRTYLVNPLVVDEMLYEFDGRTYRLYVDSCGNISKIVAE